MEILKKTSSKTRGVSRRVKMLLFLLWCVQHRNKFNMANKIESENCQKRRKKENAKGDMYVSSGVAFGILRSNPLSRGHILMMARMKRQLFAQ